MSAADTGGPAFPVVGAVGRNPSSGMTLRDYFAAKAMPSFLAFAPDGMLFGVSHDETNLAYAHVAYAMADAMLEARK